MNFDIPTLSVATSADGHNYTARVEWSDCQIASNCDPHFASNNDPLVGL